MVALFEIEQVSNLTPEQAWRQVTDWKAHSHLIPFTTIAVSPAADGGVGTVFTGHTRLGPFSFDDPMEVTRWQPPPAAVACCRLEKRGSVVLGWAEIEVRAGQDGAGNSRILWRENIMIAHLPRAFDPLVRRVSALLFGRALRRLLAA